MIDSVTSTYVIREKSSFKWNYFFYKRVALLCTPFLRIPREGLKLIVQFQHVTIYEVKNIDCEGTEMREHQTNMQWRIRWTQILNILWSLAETFVLVNGNIYYLTQLGNLKLYFCFYFVSMILPIIILVEIKEGFLI